MPQQKPHEINGHLIPAVYHATDCDYTDTLHGEHLTTKPSIAADSCRGLCPKRAASPKASEFRNDQRHVQQPSHRLADEIAFLAGFAPFIGLTNAKCLMSAELGEAALCLNKQE